MVKHKVPDWFYEVLERFQLKSLRELYDLLEMDRTEFWEAFWKSGRTDVQRMIWLEETIEDAIEKREYVKEMNLWKFSRAIEKVKPDVNLVKVLIRRADGRIQAYWVRADRLQEYRVAPKSGYLYRPRRK